MLEFKGKYTEAIVYTDNIEQSCISQIYDFLNHEAFKDLKIRIMPDVHAGKGSVIGFTSNIEDKIIPNIVGLDIGCGVLTVKLAEKEIDFEKLDNTIRQLIPSGPNTRSKYHSNVSKLKLEELKCEDISLERAKLSLGTLGGGNHFLEINKDPEGNLYLSIHSGSRYLGKQIAEYYQDLAYQVLAYDDQVEKTIKKLKAEGRHKEIQKTIKKLIPVTINKELAYLTGSNKDAYLHDMNIVQEYALLNRDTMAQTIIESMGLTVVESFHTTHNYIDIESNIVRKGAISAKEGERLVIPISMKDGIIIGTGKGNPDWNYSAPHGGGRILSRSAAKKQIKLDDFEESMKGVWTTSVNEQTIDESPFAYKSINDIIQYIGDTVDIECIAKSVYNYKNS